MGGVIGHSDFVFIFAKSKLPWGLSQQAKVHLYACRTTKIRKANLKNVFLEWVCREARPLFFVSAFKSKVSQVNLNPSILVSDLSPKHQFCF